MQLCTQNKYIYVSIYLSQHRFRNQTASVRLFSNFCKSPQNNIRVNTVFNLKSITVILMPTNLLDWNSIHHLTAITLTTIAPLVAGSSQPLPDLKPASFARRNTIPPASDSTRSKWKIIPYKSYAASASSISIKSINTPSVLIARWVTTKNLYQALLHVRLGHLNCLWDCTSIRAFNNGVYAHLFSCDNNGATLSQIRS